MRIRRISAVLVILAFWLTTSQHCNLEAAGVWPSFAESDGGHCCTDTSSGCEEDNCQIVEDGSIRASGTSLKVPAPIAVLCACNFHLHDIAASAAVESPQAFGLLVEPWLDWLPEWQFKRRAAPPSRAPSSIFA